MSVVPLSRRALLVVVVGTSFLPVLAARAEARTHVIVVDKMKFGSAPDGIRVGDTVVWANHDLFRHTATARDKSFDVDLKPNEEGRVTLIKPGRIDVYCRFHPGMTATFIVGP
jgi:plastocyanin